MRGIDNFTMEEEVTLNFDNEEIKVPKGIIERFLRGTPPEEWSNLVTGALKNIVEEYKEREMQKLFARQSACVKGKENVEPRTKSLIEIVREVKSHSNHYAQDGK